MNTIDDPGTLFKRWFEASVLALQKNLKDGDGAIAALMVVLPLYERYIHVTRNLSAEPKPAFCQLMASEFELDTQSQAETFWTTFRHGFCHTGMPFVENIQGVALPKVGLNGAYPKLPKFVTEPGGEPAIVLDPWKFAHHVLDIYRANPSLLEQHQDAPLLPIHIVTEFTLPSDGA
jgi:hypothetical protein